MKIAVDSGALCTDKEHRYGNYIFTQNLIKGFSIFDIKNHYFLYSFCKKPEDLILSKNINYKYLYPSQMWMKARVSLEEVVHEKDIFLSLNQANPLITHAKIISFSHGLSFYFYPDYYPDSFEEMMKQLNDMVKRAKYIIVSSKKVKKEMNKIFPKFKKIKVLSYGIPFDLTDVKNNESEKNEKSKYFLYVGMDHKIKNIQFLLKTFNEFIKDKRFGDFKLYLVTDSKKYEKVSKNIKVFDKIKRNKLKKLYQNASALLTASFYESFNLPVLEALSLDCPVIGLKSAIIPEMKDLAKIAHNRSEFLDHMKKTVSGERKKVDQKELKKRFSWKKYVYELVKMY